MRSGELARLAGVTVRALRHYHEVGVLAEPARGVNGYREYEVRDLIRVLRIRRLASVGIPLERMPHLLDDEAADPREALDELDVELRDQIERLTQQRRLLARLRELDAAPDLPPELAPFVSVLAGAGRSSPGLANIDRDQSVLLAHLAGHERMPRLVGLYARLSDPGLAPAVAAISERFARLGPGTTESDIADLLERFMETFEPIVGDFIALDPLVSNGAGTDLLGQYTEALFNAQQRAVVEELQRRLDTVQPSNDVSPG